jgi:hypothetical protein
MYFFLKKKKIMMQVRNGIHNDKDLSLCLDTQCFSHKIIIIIN